jgi:hypothetical protein
MEEKEEVLFLRQASVYSRKLLNKIDSFTKKISEVYHRASDMVFCDKLFTMEDVKGNNYYLKFIDGYPLS